MTGSIAEKTALVVNPDVGSLAAFQESLGRNGFICVVARDLPTALLAMSQHFFQVAIVASRISEPGDGWSLAGVLHRLFPNALITVLAPERNILALQSAINNGVTELFAASESPQQIVENVVKLCAPSSGVH